MKSIRRLFFLASALILVPAFSGAAPSATSKATPSKSKSKSDVKPRAVFTNVKGKVEVKKKGSKNRSVKKDSTASVGDRIVADKDANATLRLFDGSELKIGSKTDFQLTKLTEGEKDKNIKFKLAAGKLWAKVKKLASRRSSFEIEAGGVVCGVRGTEYSVQYDPESGKVILDVDDGTVWTDSNGQTHTFTAGQDGEFLNGNLQTDPDDQGNNQGSVNGNVGLDGNSPDALGDLDVVMGGALDTGGNNNYSDPSVGGGVKLNVIVNVDPTENLP